MAYTVKQVSEMSGITVRTLHFYEQKGLLKPAYYGSNGYRYYEQKELLQLQQILFFKRLGLRLKQIHKIIGKSNCEQIAALYSHRQYLNCEWERMSRLLRTIDKTIEHLKGKRKMKDPEFFDGLVLIKKAHPSESYFGAEETLLRSLRRNSSNVMEESERLQVKTKAHHIYASLAECLKKQISPASKNVQKLIKEHCEFSEKFYQISKHVYKALAKLYCEHPEYRKQLDQIHLGLAIFIAKGMVIFADNALA